MKRLVIIIIATVIAAKVFGLLIVKIANAPSNRISSVLHFEEGNVLDYLRTGEKTHTSEKPKVVPNPFRFSKAPPKFVASHVKPFIPSKATAKDVTSMLAATEHKMLSQKKIDEDKKDKDRRKKRRKNLEQLAEKNLTPVLPKFYPRQLPPSPQVITRTGFPSAPETAFLVKKDITANKGPLKNPVSVVRVQAAPATNISSISDQLVNHPTTALMKTFVGMYSSNQITPSQFFQVLGLMERSRVTEARRLAVVAASQTPRMESFEILAEEVIRETDQSISALASEGLKSYQSISQLSVISTALSQGGLESKIEAADVLNQIVNGYIIGKNPPGNFETLMNPFIPILDPLTKNANSTLQAKASTALQAIQAIQQLPQIIGAL